MPQAPSVALPKRLPLVIKPENRQNSTDKDSKLVNCYSERTETGEYWIYKRAGTKRSSRPPGANAAGAGMWNWLGDIYSIFGATMYKNGVALVGALNTAGGVYRFDSCLGATPKLVFGNGIAAYTYDSGAGIVEITDGDFPATFVKGWAYLNGVTYVATATAHIQGSDTNDPQNWDPLNDILAQIEPDQGIGLAKQLVYVAIFKQWSTEVFYDAGNAAGSPLGPVQGAKVNYGCVSSDSIQSIDGILIWVCTNQSASSQIIKMDGLKAEIISTNPVERLLDNADFDTVYSLQLKNEGHRFYILTAKDSNLTLVYDLDEKMWSQWTDEDGNYWPFVASTYDATTLRHQFQHETDGRIYLVNENYYTDAGEIITVEVVTPNFDGEVDRRKQMNRLTFVADLVEGSELQVRVNDHDYDPDKWSNWRTVGLDKKLPMLSNCGTFIRRAHQFRQQKPTAFRLKAINMQIDLGTL